MQLDAKLGASSSRRPAPPATTRGRKTTGLGERAMGGVSQGFLLAWGVVVSVPLLWTVVTAFKTDREIFFSPWSIPASLRVDNFVRAWRAANIGTYFVNSLIVVGCALVVVMLLGSMAAYVLARYDFPGSRTIYYLFVAGMTFPVFLALVPLFFEVKNMGLLGTYPGLVLVYAAYALPFTVFFLTGFFRTLPTALAEAAMLDGCSHTSLFFRVMLPMARPGMVSIAIFNFLGLWNQYLLPLVLMPDPDRYVITQGLASLTVQQGYQSDWSGLFAGLVLATLPVFAVYLVFQRRIQQGLSAGALK